MLRTWPAFFSDCGSSLVKILNACSRRQFFASDRVTRSDILELFKASFASSNSVSSTTGGLYSSSPPPPEVPVSDFGAEEPEVAPAPNEKPPDPEPNVNPPLSPVFGAKIFFLFLDR